MRILVVAAAVASVLLAPAVSEACGFWYLHRPGSKKKAARVYVHTARIGKRVMRIEYEGGNYVARVDGRRWATLEGTTLKRRGKTVGEVALGKLTVRGVSYEVKFGRPANGRPSPYFASMEVRRNGKTLYTSDAVMGFARCAGAGRLPRRDQIRDVLARLAFMLLRRGR
jgi:hypothetical protein